MTETRLEVYANAAGLLSRMGYHARVIPDYNRPPITGPVVALSTLTWTPPSGSSMAGPGS